MKILSTKLPLKSEVTKEQVYQTIIRWLKDSKPCAAAGEQFERAENKDNVRIVDGYATIETLTGKKNDTQYVAIRLTHIYREQTWETEILYGESATEKSVTIHVNCSGDKTTFKKTADSAHGNHSRVYCRRSSGEWETAHTSRTDLCRLRYDRLSRIGYEHAL